MNDTAHEKAQECIAALYDPLPDDLSAVKAEAAIHDAFASAAAHEGMMTRREVLDEALFAADKFFESVGNHHNELLWAEVRKNMSDDLVIVYTHMSREDWEWYAAAEASMENLVRGDWQMCEEDVFERAELLERALALACEELVVAYDGIAGETGEGWAAEFQRLAEVERGAERE